MLGANAFGWAYPGQAYAGTASTPTPETPTPQGGFFHTPVPRRQRPERKPQTLVFAVNPATILADAAPAQLHITIRPEPGRASGQVAPSPARLDVTLVARLAHIAGAYAPSADAFTRKSEDDLAEMVRDTLCALEI